MKPLFRRARATQAAACLAAVALMVIVPTAASAAGPQVPAAAVALATAGEPAWGDVNGNGVRDPGEPVWQVDLYKYINGQSTGSAPGINVMQGSTMEFGFQVVNSGDQPLTDIVVTDDTIAAADISCPTTTLQPEVGMLCTASLPAPAVGECHANTGTVTAIPDLGPAPDPAVEAVAPASVTASDSAHACTPVPPPSSMTVVKSINGQDANSSPGAIVVPGSTMDFEFLIINTGMTHLVDVTVTDDQIPASDIFCPAMDIRPGQQMTCTASLPAPPAGECHLNTAVVTAIGINGGGGGNNRAAAPRTGPVSASDVAHACATLSAEPAVSLVKSLNGDDAETAPGVSVAAGSSMNFTFEVSNLGPVILENVEVTDDQLAAADISCPATTLGVFETMTCTATLPAPAAGECHVNTATVVGTPQADPGTGGGGARPAAPGDVTDTDMAHACTAEATETSTTPPTSPPTSSEPTTSESTTPEPSDSETTSPEPSDTETTVPSDTETTTPQPTASEESTTITVLQTGSTLMPTAAEPTVAPSGYQAAPMHADLANTGVSDVNLMLLVGGALLAVGLLMVRIRRNS